MKQFATLLMACFALQLATAQYVIVNSPSSIAGVKGFNTGAGSVDLTTNVWTGDCVLVSDGSATPTIGCATLTNAAAVAGKFAVIDRGTCSFSQKVANAQAAGATAAVIFNNTAGAGTIVMGVTAGFPTVTIPVVMLSYEDGLEIKAAMAAGTVNMTIGAVKFPNDLHIDKKTLLNPPYGTVPSSQAAGLTFAPGAAVKNNGLNDSHNVDVNGVIKFTPAAGGAASIVYNKTGSVGLLPVDSTELVTLPEFTVTGTPGKYAMTYNITSDSIDNVDTDNDFASELTISDNVYSHARWDAANKRPYQTNAYRPATSTIMEFINGYEFPAGKGLSIDSLKFYISTQATDLTVLQQGTLNVFVYEWHDDDADGFLADGELTAKSIEEVSFSTPGQKSAWVTAPVNDINNTNGASGLNISDDGAAYFVGVRYEGDTIVFIGFDEGFDYTANIELTPDPVSEIHYGYLGTTVWNNLEPSIGDLFTFTGLRAAVSYGVYVNPSASNAVADVPGEVSISLLPNPVSDELVADVRLLESTESIQYTIRDAAGRLISRSETDVYGDHDKVSFNVSKLAAGQYFLQVKSAKGQKTTAFTVQH